MYESDGMMIIFWSKFEKMYFLITRWQKNIDHKMAEKNIFLYIEKIALLATLYGSDRRMKFFYSKFKISIFGQKLEKKYYFEFWIEEIALLVNFV